MDDRVDGLKEILSEVGYDIAFRDDAWVECLVWSDVEGWVGRGTGRDDALRDAIRQMFPSRAARKLLESALSARHPPAPEVPAEEATKGALPAHGEVTAFVASSQAQAAPVVAPPAPAAPPGDRAEAEAPAPPSPCPSPPPPPSPSPAAAPPAEPASARAAKTADPPPAIFDEPAPRAPGPEPVSVSAARLEKLLSDIDACQAVLACLAPERQRLWLLIWICRARAEQEIHPSAQEIHRGVARVARRLGEIAKTFWPGSVRALQINASASDLGLGRRQGEAMPHTWAEAATFAERVLDDQLAQAERAGLDEDGWADAAMLEPRPTDIEGLFAQVATEIEKLAETGGNENVERLTQLARMLRWMRGGVRDALRWGMAMGRLRQLAHTLGDRAEALREACDPKFKPKRPWASIAGGENVKLHPVAGPSPSVPDPPDVSAGAAALAAWLVGAFVLDTPTLAARLVSRKDEICAMDDSALPSPDRRLRRRFRELKRRLASSEATVEQAPPVERAPADGEDDMSGADRQLDRLASVVRPHTAGRRALFVSNRHDPPLQAKLEEILGLTITWCEATPRRVQAQAERVANRAFDLVLSATGFQVHAVDTALSKAAKSASVPLVRVDRGRPVACIRAIARELGIAERAEAEAR